MRTLKPTIALLLLMSATGCQLFGAVANAFPKYKPAEYLLPNRPTLVLVDDPKGFFGDAQMLSAIAANAGADLKHSETVTLVIEQKQVAELASRMGDKYAEMGVDRIGRELGAVQVIHVTARAAEMVMAPGVLRPSAVVEVVVIDIEARRRLFPPGSEATGVPDNPGTRGGHMVSVSLRAKISDMDNQRAMDAVRQRLAERLGERVGQLFHEHEIKPDEDLRAR